MNSGSRDYLLEKISQFFRRLQNLSYRCRRAARIKASAKQYTPAITKSPLQEKLNSILNSGAWDDSRLELFLSSAKGKTGNEAAMIIAQDAEAISNFLERVSHDLHESPTWLSEEETVAAKDSGFKIKKDPSFIFEIETAIGSLDEAATRALVQQETSRDHYLKSQAGGKKPKKAEPLLRAAEVFLEMHPKIRNRSLREIVVAFCKKYKDSKPLEIRIGDDVYEIFSDRQCECIFFRTVESTDRNKRNSDAKSITLTTFAQRYISAAKNSLSFQNH